MNLFEPVKAKQRGMKDEYLTNHNVNHARHREHYVFLFKLIACISSLLTGRRVQVMIYGVHH